MRAYESPKRAYGPHKRREKREKRVHKRQNFKQNIWRVVGKRAYESQKRAYESQKRAYEHYKRREKRGKRVHKRAYESHKRAYEPQKRAYESQKRREKRENVLEFGRLETTGSHTSHIFSATQSTRQQDSKLVRVMLCLRGKRKAQNHCLFSTFEHHRIF